MDAGADFEWNEVKDAENREKHVVSFLAAQAAFEDPLRIIVEDSEHSRIERRLYCIGRAGAGILTVRFTLRGDRVRIFGAGYWRRGKEFYEQENQIH